MSFINTSSDFPDFKRFFYDQVSLRTDFFEEPNPKMNQMRLFEWFSNSMKGKKWENHKSAKNSSLPGPALGLWRKRLIRSDTEISSFLSPSSLKQKLFIKKWFLSSVKNCSFVHFYLSSKEKMSSKAEFSSAFWVLERLRKCHEKVFCMISNPFWLYTIKRASNHDNLIHDQS